MAAAAPSLMYIVITPAQAPLQDAWFTSVPVSGQIQPRPSLMTEWLWASTNTSIPGTALTTSADVTSFADGVTRSSFQPVCPTPTITAHPASCRLLTAERAPLIVSVIANSFSSRASFVVRPNRPILTLFEEMKNAR